MAKEGKNLVIIESPYKAKTIGKILGKDYIVAASGGHLRDLPKNKMSVDLENGFIPDYQPIKGKEQTINELRKAQTKAKKYILQRTPTGRVRQYPGTLRSFWNCPMKKLFV